MATECVLINVVIEKLTMWAHGKVKVFNVYKAIKFPVIYEELSTIKVIDLESELPFITSKDPLERALVDMTFSVMQKQMKWFRF